MQTRNLLASIAVCSVPLFGHALLTTTRNVDPLETSKMVPSKPHRILVHTMYTRPEYGSHRISWIQTCLILIYSLLAVLGVISNALVAYILLFIRRRTLSNITNIFVLVLAISDILLCGFNMPFQMYYELKETAPLNFISCKLVFSIFGIPMHISCLIILLIACDRYQIIIYPLYPRMSTRLAMCLVTLVVLVSIGNSIPVALYSTLITVVHHPNISEQEMVHSQEKKNSFTGSHNYCVEQWTSKTSRLIYSLTTFLIHFFIPLILTACLYGHIFCRLHERRFNRGGLERKRRTNKILIRIVLCFIICWTPWACFSLWLEFYAYFVQSAAETQMMPGANVSETALLDFVSLSLISKRDGKDTSSFISEEFDDKYLYSDNLQNIIQSDAPQYTRFSGLVQSTPHLMSHPIEEFPNFDISKFEIHLRAIDLCLKLFAMGSGCINPWLYGWFNKYFLSILKMFWKRTVHQTNWTGKLKKGMKRLRCVRRIQVSEKEFSVNHKRSIDFESSIGIKSVTDGNQYAAHNNKSYRRACYCCGAYCTIRIMYKPRRSIKCIDRNSLIKSHTGHEKNYKGSYKDSSNKESGRKTDSCERCAAAVARTGSGSRTSHSGSGRNKGSRQSVELLGSTINGLIRNGDPMHDISEMDNNANSNKREKECQQCGGYRRFGRRFSPRFSGSSTGTFSYLDPSTKQTSLYPSSAFTPTPRGSFQRSTDQNSCTKLELPITAKLTPPSLGLSVPPLCAETITNNRRESDVERKFNTGNSNFLQYSHCMHSESGEEQSESDSDNHVITLFCPQIQPEQRRVQLLTVHEQSDSTSNKSTTPYDDHTQDVIQISVHIPESETDVRALELPSFPVTNFELTAEKIPSIATGSNPIEVAKDIPFADDEDDQVKLTTDKPDFSDTIDEQLFVPSNLVPALFSESSEKLSLSRSSSTSVKCKPELRYQGSEKKTAENPNLVHKRSNSRLRRRFSIYPSFMFHAQGYIRNRTSSSDLHRQLTLKESRRRESVRHLREEVKKLKQQQRAGIDEVKRARSSLADCSVDETSDVDDFAQISRLVALEALRKKQARARAHSLGASPEDKLGKRLYRFSINKS